MKWQALICRVFGHPWQYHHTSGKIQPELEPGSPWFMIYPNGGIDTYQCQRCGQYETGIMVRGVDWDSVKAAARAKGWR